MAATVRIEAGTDETLSAIAKAKSISKSEAITRAVELLQRELFFEELNAGFAALRADSDAWAEEKRDRDAWDATSADGLADQ